MNKSQSARIDSTWAPQFRIQFLYNLPTDEIGKLYCPDNGRPTKELKAVIGALILQHLFDLTDHEACQRYLHDARWSEALDLDALDERDRHISPRTLWERSKKLAGSGLRKRS
jgi:hypothetical protein